MSIEEKLLEDLSYAKQNELAQIQAIITAKNVVISTQSTCDRIDALDATACLAKSTEEYDQFVAYRSHVIGINADVQADIDRINNANLSEAVKTDYINRLDPIMPIPEIPKRPDGAAWKAAQLAALDADIVTKTAAYEAALNENIEAKTALAKLG